MLDLTIFLETAYVHLIAYIYDKPMWAIKVIPLTCRQIFVTAEVQASKVFRNSTRKVANAVRQAARLLGKHSIPFW